jgi:hypothetical protein
VGNDSSKGSEGGDEKNTAFGLPVNIAHHKSGFDGTVAKEEAGTSKDLRRRPGEEKDIPQESLAARIAKNRKGK